MASNSEFWEAYKHPEWQRRKTEIMIKAEFECQECRNKERTLNVHHRYYRKGAKPWEYPDDALVCLCEVCHKGRHVQMDELKKHIGYMDSSRIDLLIGMLKSWSLQDKAGPYSDDPVVISSNGELFGFADAYGIDCFHCFDADDMWTIADENDGFKHSDVIRYVYKANLSCGGCYIPLNPDTGLRQLPNQMKSLIPELTATIDWEAPKANG